MVGFRIYYVLAAIVAVPLSFAKLFGTVESEGVRRTFDRNLYELADAGFTVDEIGLVLLYVLIVSLLIAGVWWPRTVAPQLAIIVLGVLAAIILLVKPDTGDPEPPFALGGGGLLALALSGVVVAGCDVLARRSSRHRRGAPAG